MPLNSKQRQQIWTYGHKAVKHGLTNYGTYASAWQLAKDAHSTYKKLKTNHSNSNDHMGALTTQYDAAVIYKNSKRKGRKRRRLTKFAHKIQKALATTDAKGHLSLMRTWNTTTTAGQQNFNGISFYGYGSGDADVQDLFLATSQISLGVDRNFQLYAESAHCDFLATNTSAASVNIVLKVYDLSYKKDMLLDWGNNIGNFWINTFIEAYDTGANSNVGTDGIVDQSTVGTVAPNTLGPLIPGLTPFDSSTFGRRVKIMKVTEFIMAPGETISFNRSMMKSGNIAQDFFDQRTNANFPTGNPRVWATPHWTKTCLFVYHGVPRAPATNTRVGFYPAASLCLVANKSYNYTRIDNDGDTENREIRTIV